MKEGDVAFGLHIPNDEGWGGFVNNLIDLIGKTWHCGNSLLGGSIHVMLCLSAKLGFHSKKTPRTDTK